MTAVLGDAGTPKVAFPARCEVSIAYGKALVSQVCPAGIPVEAFFGGLVELLDDELKKHGHDGVALPGSYELLKANGVRLDLTRSFDDLGIEDGQTLVLVPVTAGASFEPQIESLSTALAVTAKGLGTLPDVVCDECGHKAGEREVANLLASKVDKMFRPITETTAAHVAIALVALAVTVVGAPILRARTFTDNWVPATIAAGIGAVLVTAAVVSWRGWPDRRDLFSGFGGRQLDCWRSPTCAPPGPPGCAARPDRLDPACAGRDHHQCCEPFRCCSRKAGAGV